MVREAVIELRHYDDFNSALRENYSNDNYIGRKIVCIYDANTPSWSDMKDIFLQTAREAIIHKTEDQFFQINANNLDLETIKDDWLNQIAPPQYLIIYEGKLLETFQTSTKEGFFKYLKYYGIIDDQFFEQIELQTKV